MMRTSSQAQLGMRILGGGREVCEARELIRAPAVVLRRVGTGAPRCVPAHEGDSEALGGHRLAKILGRDAMGYPRAPSLWEPRRHCLGGRGRKQQRSDTSLAQAPFSRRPPKTPKQGGGGGGLAFVLHTF